MHGPSIVHKQRHFYHWLKTPKTIEKKTPIMFTLLHFMEAATRNCSLTLPGSVQHLWSKNPLVLSMTLILAITTSLSKSFLLNTSAWLLLKSKFYFEFYSMFCLKFACCRRDFCSFLSHGL